MTNDHIRACTCSNEYQDKRYKGKRVKTPTKRGYRCTVCGKEENVVKEVKPKKEE